MVFAVVVAIGAFCLLALAVANCVIPTFYTWRRSPVLVPIALIGVVMGGCGGADLTAKSTCKDYVAESPGQRDVAVSKIAQDLNAPKAAGLGRPNIDNACVASPNTTLGTVINRYRPADQAPAVSSSNNGVANVDDTQALHLIQTSEKLPPKLESSGFQLDSVGVTGGGTARELISAKVAERSNDIHILPDGVTLEAFSRLLDKALITVVQPGDYGEQPSCIFCKMKVVTPDTPLDKVSWVVTFPPEGESTAQYLAKLRAEYGG